jgi:hypothetical protein
MAKPQGPLAFLKKIDHQLCANFKRTNCRGKSQKPFVAKPKVKVEKRVPEPKLVPQPFPPEPVTEQPPPAPGSLVTPRQKPSVDVSPAQSSDTPCLQGLKSKKVDFMSVPQPAGLPGCSVHDPVKINGTTVNGVHLQFPDQPILNCGFAMQFVTWLQEQGGPAATAKEGFALTKFYTGPGYQCRGRNGDVSSKISEHGYGNAVDVERIAFSDGQVFMVHDAPDPSSKAYETLRAIRASACTRFTTVLGPGSNEAHREHFHFDLGTHGKSGTYKICE